MAKALYFNSKALPLHITLVASATTPLPPNGTWIPNFYSVLDVITSVGRRIFSLKRNPRRKILVID